MLGLKQACEDGRRCIYSTSPATGSWVFMMEGLALQENEPTHP